MGQKRFDRLYDYVRHGVNIQLDCANRACSHIGIVDAYEAVRWFKVHRWPDTLDTGLGLSALTHFYCSKCRARPDRARATTSNPTVTQFFPADEAGWKALIRRLRG